MAKMTQAKWSLLAIPLHDRLLVTVARKGFVNHI